MDYNEKQTGPKEVFDILRKAPVERLISLTFQLSETPADRLIHALTLLVLQREEQALEKLNTLQDCDLAKHLAGKWEGSGGQLEDFATSCAHLEDSSLESLVLLARVFTVLSEQRLCDLPLRNLAYKRALFEGKQKTSHYGDQAYENLREEAKMVCGFEEWMNSSPYLRSASHQDSQSSFGRGSTALGSTLSQGQLQRVNSLPSPLKASSMPPSYPSHLEISIPPTSLYPEERSTPEMSQTSNNNNHMSESVANVGLGDSQPGTSQRSDFAPNADSGRDEDLQNTKSQTPLGLPSQPSITSTSGACASHVTLPSEMQREQEAEECEDDDDDEETFYAFVILHAPVDAEVAESMRVRLEGIIGCKGATFSDDFALAGKSTLRCVEDAINNTAFTILLLTRNYNTHMHDLEANSALLNSVNKIHKHNTVIPLLPQQNSMPRQDISMVLQTIVPLVEDRNFEKKVQRSMSKATIKKQYKLWTVEQKVKRQERQRLLKEHRTKLVRGAERTRSLESDNIRLLMAQKLLQDSPDSEQCSAWLQIQQQQQPNIHISNAKFIMIGNDSQMTIGLGEDLDLPDLENREEDRK